MMMPLISSAVPVVETSFARDTDTSQIMHVLLEIFGHHEDHHFTACAHTVIGCPSTGTRREARYGESLHSRPTWQRLEPLRLCTVSKSCSFH